MLTTTIASDFKNKSRPFYSAAIETPKNSMFLAINHGPISFDRDTYKGNRKIPTPFTIIRPLAAGWSSVPYKKNQKGVATMKLAEYNGGSDPYVRMYSFQKASNNMDKGPRCNDLFFDLRAGDTFKYWLDEQRVDEILRNKQVPAMIQPFTVCEIQIAPKNNEGASKGSGCKITEVKTCSITLNSCLADLEKLPPTLADARAAALKNQQAQVCIANDLITNEAPFHVYVSHKAYIHEDEVRYLL